MKCAVCLSEFVPQGKRTKTCSAKCTAEHKIRLRKSWPKTHQATWRKHHPLSNGEGMARWMAECEKRKHDKEIEKNIKTLSWVISMLKKRALKKLGKLPCSQCGKDQGNRDNICTPCKKQYAYEYARSMKANSPDLWRERIKASMSRMMENPYFKLKLRLRQRMQKAIRKYAKGFTASGSKLLYLGCSAPQACAYIQSLWTDGMSWENYGTAWHVDHVYPLAGFDLNDESQRKRAFHYTNLQPLGAKENISKGDKRPQAGHQPMLLMASPMRVLSRG